MHTQQQTQAQLLKAVRSIVKTSIAAHSRKSISIVHDCDSGVLVCASVAQVQHIFTAALQLLCVSADPTELAQLAAATGCEDTQINFTYNNYNMYLVSCYTS